MALGLRALAWWAWATLIFLACAVPASAQSTAGRLDLAFGNGGLAFTPPGTAGEEADVELANVPGGSVVVGNALEGRLVRFLPDGSRDTAFGESGELHLGPETAREGVDERTFWSRSVAVDSRGRVLVFGEQTDTRQFFITERSVPASSAVVLRFSDEGHPDPSFGEGKGFIREDFGLGSGLNTDIPMVSALAGRVDSRDRPVLVAGLTSPTSGCYAHGGVGSRPRAVVRLTESGQPDPTFGGGDGVSPIEGSASFPGLGIDGKDRPVAGVGRIGSPTAECQLGTTLFRLGEDGERLSAFGSDGIRVFKWLSLAVLEPSGTMILSSRHDQTLSLVRLRPNGSRDMSFGQGGVARVHLPLDIGFHARPVAVDPRGRILLAGFIGSPIAEPAKRQPKHSAFVVARLLPSGKPDLGFGTHSWIITRFARPLEVTSAQATLDPRGHLLVAGTVTKPHREGGFAIARYLLGS
jgi:uncharacterized delta-60 repeat protein